MRLLNVQVPLMSNTTPATVRVSGTCRTAFAPTSMLIVVMKDPMMPSTNAA
ncbi:hypothetical protein DPMN_003938 [Dreissena polymorpha]|uniref:Uncharacterized protein n=1 Tax=Dreissena polymorpha TaxID=45954 RepID=A0A9D4MPD4_DREPO|nr:hypothetical protein DPMN_003938 [Dreissena polymorpha]